jgi:hypothetical protein
MKPYVVAISKRFIWWSDGEIITKEPTINYLLKKDYEVMEVMW